MSFISLNGIFFVPFYESFRKIILRILRINHLTVGNYDICWYAISQHLLQFNMTDVPFFSHLNQSN